MHKRRQRTFEDLNSQLHTFVREVFSCFEMPSQTFKGGEKRRNTHPSANANANNRELLVSVPKEDSGEYRWCVWNFEISPALYVFFSSRARCRVRSLSHSLSFPSLR